MCGIVGGVAQRDIVSILMEGLKRLEVRGYDSAGLAIVDTNASGENAIQCLRVCGKVQELGNALNKTPILGPMGIAHTRWATHGKPNTENAHPQMAGEEVALVHNGIIDNYAELRDELLQKGVVFRSQTDSEVIAHLIHFYFKQDPSNCIRAVQTALSRLTGAFALAIIFKQYPECIIVARRGSPVLIGLGIGENFIASDTLALLPVTQQFVMLEEGDLAVVYKDRYEILDSTNQIANRDIKTSQMTQDSLDKAPYRHFMQKEIFEQPLAVTQALTGRLDLQNSTFIEEAIFHPSAHSDIGSRLDAVKQLQIVACGTSYHAGLIAQFWIENWLHIPCQVDIASEMRYRAQLARPGTLFITLSQSGETADILGALRAIKDNPAYCGTMAICNVAESTLVRESDFVLLTQAGREIGVASTKAFTTQLVALLMLVACLDKRLNKNLLLEKRIVGALQKLPDYIEQVLTLDKPIEKLAQRFARKRHALFLGRGLHYPIAREGALKLKEISYIHAEAYPAGELKHGPLALVDKNMPVIALLPNDALAEKMKSNLEVVSTRGGEVILFTQPGIELPANSTALMIPLVDDVLSPIMMTIPLQLLAYHVAVLKGTDVDQPRNLAKSVTVE